MSRILSVLAIAWILCSSAALADVPSVFKRHHGPPIPGQPDPPEDRAPIVEGVVIAVVVAGGGLYLIRHRRRR